MKPSIIRPLLVTLMLLLAGGAHAQKTMLQQSIYFESAKYNLTAESKATLDRLTDSLRNFSTYRIFIKGNTDDVGDSTYNKTLSLQRVRSVEEYFMAHGVKKTVFTTSALGEEKPVADNLTDEGKQKNRRVDISISFTRKLPAPTILPSIHELYKQTEIAPQQFCINPVKDTILRCSKGTLVYVKANSFKLSAACKTRCVTIKIKEDFLKSEMILDNLSTTSNGRPLETQGMVYTEANDCTGKRLNLSRGKDLVVFVPTDTILPRAQIFQGNRTPHDSIINWTVSNTSVLGNFTLTELNICSGWICGGVRYTCERCKFFFCRTGRAGVALKGIVNKTTHRDNVRFRACQQRLRDERRLARKQRSTQPLPVSSEITERPEIDPELLPECERLEALYNKYRVTDYVALLEAVNKPLMDSLGVKTFQELRDTMTRISINNFERAYLNKSISYNDFKYYVYNTSRLGWSNIDVFADIPKRSMVNMTIRLKPATNIDCKLVFIDRRFVIPAEKLNDYYTFENLPIGERVWIVALKFDDGKPYLFMQETTIDSKIHDVEFKVYTLEELKQQLGKLDQ